ncbi:MAG: hypothetical protein ACR650_00095 [Methylocystis sp.]
MADEEVRASPSYPPEAVVDALFLRETCAELEEVLRRARHEVSYFRGEIGSLASEPNLPCLSKRRMAESSHYSRLSRRRSLTATKCLTLREQFHSSGLLDWKEGELAAPPVAMEAARSVIHHQRSKVCAISGATIG